MCRKCRAEWGCGADHDCDKRYTSLAATQAVFQTQRIRAGSLLSGTWRKTRLERAMAQSERGAQSLEEEDDDEDDGEEGECEDSSGARLEKLPTGVSKKARVIALTKFVPHDSSCTACMESDGRSKAKTARAAPDCDSEDQPKPKKKLRRHV